MTVAEVYAGISRSAETFNRYFHPPYKNNYSLVYISRNFNLEAYGADTISSFNVLNNVVTELRAFCFRELAAFRQSLPAGEVPADLAKCELFLQLWEKELGKRNYFLSFDYIRAVMEGFRKLNIDFYGKLATQQNLRSIINEFNPLYRSLVRVDLYLDYAEVPAAFSELVNMMAADPLIMNNLERIELAQPDFQESSLSKALNRKPYPLLNIFFVKQIRTLDHPAVHQLKFMLEEWEQGAEPGFKNLDYCADFTARTAITQGYRNYKNILRILGRLDEIYTASSNYSQIIGTDL